MTNVNKAFTWDLLGSAFYMGELAARKPARDIDHLTPEIKNIRIKDFIVESANEFFTANGIPEIPFSDVVIENGEIKCKKLISALNDARHITLRHLTIESESNEINLLDCQDVQFFHVDFILPTNELIVNVEGDDNKDICFDGGSVQGNACFDGINPMRVQLK